MEKNGDKSHLSRVIRHFFSVIANIILTPSGYRADYFLSMTSPRVLSTNPIPWINYKAFNYLKHSLNKSVKVFEYGSGSSTLYWMKRCAEINSVEHDRKFYDQISPQLNSSVRYFFAEPEASTISSLHSPASPDLFQSTDFKGCTFEKYVKLIDAFQDEYFDVVVVDGRARPSCIKRALPKIKTNGILIVDNSDRAYYWSQTSQLLAGWPQKVFRGTVRGLLHQEQTSVFVKPKV